MARCGCAEACNCVLISGGGVTVSGTGSSEDPYVITYSGPGGSFVTVTDTATVDMTITGDGSVGTPYNISAVVIPGTVIPQTEATQDIVGGMVSDGLEYDDPAGTISVKISTDPNNNAVIGSDGGIYTGVTSGAVGSSIIAYKGTDQTINSNTTFQPDAALFIPVSSGATYILDTGIVYSTPQAADLKLGWSVPAAAQLFWTTTGAHQGTTTPTNTATDYTMQTELPNFHVVGGGDATVMWAPCRGTLIVGANSGVLQLNWAQNTSDPGNTTVYDISFIRLTRVV